jgi:hypothetical protein
MWGRFVAEGGDAGQDGPEDGLAEWDVAPFLCLATTGTHATVIALPVKFDPVVSAHRQQVIDQASDTASRVDESATEHTGKG